MSGYVNGHSDWENDFDGVDDEPDFDDIDDDGIDMEFADPGGKSALRASSPSNPRNLPCPNCGQPNRLTPKDKALGYQCDSCTDAQENGWDREY